MFIFPQVSQNIPINFTGADFYALCSDALLLALKRKVTGIDKIVEKRNDSKNKFQICTARSVLSEMSSCELAVSVKESDFLSSLKNITPSLSQKELAKYEELKHKFSSFET